MTATAPVPEMRHTALAAEARAAAALQKIADTLGQAFLARHLEIAPRSLRAYLAYERATPDWVLGAAIDALGARARELDALAARLRGSAA